MNPILIWYILRRRKDILDTPIDLMNNWIYYPLTIGLIAWISFCAYCIYRMVS